MKPSTSNIDPKDFYEIFKHFITLNDIRLEHRCPEICLASVKYNGFNLKHVPDALKTPELCLEAITQNFEALKYSPFSVLELLTQF